uniref:Uncharacterized protein n=1 Tax=Arundo donax TaxID=35708 RepID=A0A0A9BHW6_ARUDO
MHTSLSLALSSYINSEERVKIGLESRSS